MPPQRPGLLQSIAGRLFPSGPAGGLLDPEQMQGLQRQGLLQLGLGLLANSGQRVVGTPGAGVGERIASAFQGVNWPQMAQQAAQQQIGVTQFQQQQQGQQAFQQIAAKYKASPNETPEQRFQRISAMTSELAGIPGTEEMVGRLSNVLAQLKPESTSSGTPQHRVIQTPEGPRLAYFNEATRTWEATSAQPVAETGDVNERERFNRSLLATVTSGFRQDTRELRNASEAFSVIRAAEEGDSPASPLALLYAYAKLLDPGSVVREGELAVLQRIGARDERIRQALSQEATGQMSPDIKRYILEQAKLIARQRLQDFDSYREDAIAAGEVQGLPRSVLDKALPDYYRRFRASQPKPGARPPLSFQ